LSKKRMKCRLPNNRLNKWFTAITLFQAVKYPKAIRYLT
jgi:hypothetical protein